MGKPVTGVPVVRSRGVRADFGGRDNHRCKSRASCAEPAMMTPNNSNGIRPGAAKRLLRKASRAHWLAAYAWQRITRSIPGGNVHLIFAVADHFEPAIVPEDGRARAPRSEQERREYPKCVERWRDHEGHPFVHTYFYPAEQYDRELVQSLAYHCRRGWGEIEIHLHHGMESPDTAEHTRRQIETFRDTLVANHQMLSFLKGSREPRYAFVHGNFALANSAGGFACGVDSEMKILAETGCYADLTLPAAAFHPAQIAKVNSLYECGLPLDQRAPHRQGLDLRAGRPAKVFPLIVQGPLMVDFDRSARNGFARIENAALIATNPPSLRRLNLWKKAAIAVQGRPDWLFIKLHCHSMDPAERDGVLGPALQLFLSELVEQAPQRKEIIHFVTAREMVNIIWAACDGREGSPGEYRDYRLKPTREHAAKIGQAQSPTLIVRT
jgi:hypothetical protein